MGGALAAYALALGGSRPGGVTRTADTVFGIQPAAGALPAALTILAVLVMTRYSLTDARHAEILKEIQGRRIKTAPR